MATIIRAAISTKNKYWIDKHRHYELKHFCLQYPIWKKAYNSLDGLTKNHPEIFAKTSHISYPTAKCAEIRARYSRWMQMVEEASDNTDAQLSKYILRAVTEELSYDTLRTMYNIPCGKDAYYELYRRFFYILNKIRERYANYTISFMKGVIFMYNRAN